MDLVAEFEQLSASALDKYVTSQQEENLHLEFKTIGKRELTRDDRKNFATALSAFANSDGGIVIWGVVAKRNEDGIDCASAVVGVESGEMLVAQLNEFTGSSTPPVVDGVRHRAISFPDGRHCVASLIPASDSGPHMAKAGEDRYFKRSGASCYRMEHFDLEDMFGRRKRPDLKLAAAVMDAGRSSRGGRTTYFGKIVLSIVNAGRGAAHAPYLTVRCNGPYQVDQFGIDGNGNEGIPRLHQAGNSAFAAFGANSLVVIHPGTLHDVCALRIQMDSELQSLPDLEVSYELAAEEWRLTERTLRIAGAEIVTMITGRQPA